MSAMADRRKHNRHRFSVDTWALLNRRNFCLDNFHKMSMGEIAINLYKSSPSHIGKIIDISMDGLAFCYFHESGDSRQLQRVTIVCLKDRIMVGDLAVRSVSHIDVDPEFSLSPLKRKRYGLRFAGLDAVHKNRLAHFIAHCKNKCHQ